MKLSRLRPAAQGDAVALTRWYAESGRQTLGARFFDAARAALQRLERMPGLGSPSRAAEMGMPGLRHWGIEGFPARWFYLEREDHLDVLRLLGERQDIAALLAAELTPAA